MSVESKVCEACEAKVGKDDKVCPACGVDFEELEEAVSVVDRANKVLAKRNIKPQPEPLPAPTKKENIFKRGFGKKG